MSALIVAGVQWLWSKFTWKFVLLYVHTHIKQSAETDCERSEKRISQFQGNKLSHCVSLTTVWLTSVFFSSYLVDEHTLAPFYHSNSVLQLLCISERGTCLNRLGNRNLCTHLKRRQFLIFGKLAYLEFPHCQYSWLREVLPQKLINEQKFVRQILG